MTNNIIIDGWNLAWKIPDIAKYIPDDLARARVQLNLLLKNHFQGKKTGFKVIYDGKPGYIQDPGYDRSVDTRFSRDPEKADHMIIKHIRRQKRPERWTVITSDRELAGKVHNLGALVIDADEFLNKLRYPATVKNESSAKLDPNLKPDEIDFWLKTFKKQ